jgi:hypothetical protein
MDHRPLAQTMVVSGGERFFEKKLYVPRKIDHNDLKDELF